mgnify:CR=1 FL=1
MAYKICWKKAAIKIAAILISIVTLLRGEAGEYTNHLKTPILTRTLQKKRLLMKRTLFLLLLILACCLSNGTPPAKHSQRLLAFQTEETHSLHELPHWLREASSYKTPEILPESLIIDSLFGTLTITHPLLIELFRHPVLERIKEVDQHGPATHFGSWPTWSRSSAG